MRRHGSRVFVLAPLWGGMTLLASCSVATSFSGLAGTAADAAVAQDAAVPDAGPAGLDASVTYESCAALHAAQPAAPSGTYPIDPDGAGPVASFSGYCDMTMDDGGWLRIDDAHLTDDTKQGVTLVRSTASSGALQLRVYANTYRCGSSGMKPGQLSFISPDLSWSHIRFTQAFFGQAACWTIAGGTDGELPLSHGTLPFDPAVDVARDALLMSGTNGDAFPGKTGGCDQSNGNFWFRNTTKERHVTIILRRDMDKQAGLASSCDCEDNAPGTMSPTYWDYREIYVR